MPIVFPKYNSKHNYFDRDEREKVKPVRYDKLATRRDLRHDEMNTGNYYQIQNESRKNSYTSLEDERWGEVKGGGS